MSNTIRSKADKIRAHRERCVELVRQGKLSVDEYLKQVCGLVGEIPTQLRAAALEQIRCR